MPWTSLVLAPSLFQPRYSGASALAPLLLLYFGALLPWALVARAPVARHSGPAPVLEFALSRADVVYPAPCAGPATFARLRAGL